MPLKNVYQVDYVVRDPAPTPTPWSPPQDDMTGSIQIACANDAAIPAALAAAVPIGGSQTIAVTDFRTLQVGVYSDT